MSMQRLKLGTVALWAFAFAGTASAADLLPVAPLAPLPVFNWTGCYIGGYAGGAWNNQGVTFADLGNSTFRAFSGGAVTGRLEGSHSWNVGLDDSSFLGGGTLGCNWQPVGSPFVLGIEGEGGYMHFAGSGFDPFRSPTLPAITPDVSGSARIGNWYAMATGRLGYAWGQTLFYVKGGAAFVPVQASVVDQCASTAAGCGNWLISTSHSDTFTTGTLGGGVEFAFAKNLSVKAEYMFIGLGGDDGLTTCGLATTGTGTIIPGGQFCFNHDFFDRGIHTVKFGFNYQFWGPGFLSNTPILAGY
jgi:outer membrane immunogenic protein